MRYLMELGSPESVDYNVFCCSHITLAFFMFLVLDTTMCFFQFIFELYGIIFLEEQDVFWMGFYAISLLSVSIGVAALCDVPMAVLTFGYRIFALLCITAARFLMSIRDVSSSETPAWRETVNLLQVVPLIVYTIGVFLVIRLFSYSTGRYRGYYDVDVELRNAVKREFANFEATKSD